jgi:hypothetical protein
MSRRKQMLEDLDQDIRDHIERETLDIERGMLPEDTRYAALRRFGNVMRIQEDTRAVWTIVWLKQLLGDIRFGLRMLRKHPGFTTVAVLTLGLGIGANSAMYSVVEGVVFAPLQYFQPDRLVMMWENNPRFPRVFVSYPNFLDWQHTSRSFQQMAAFMEQGVDLTGPGTPEHLKAKEISRGFFGTLGTELSLGREFSPEEDRHGGAPVAILSNRLWRNRFNGSRGALGKSVTLDGVDYAIVGIAPAGFRLEDDADVYTPLGGGDPLILNDREGHDGIFSVARLAPGVTLSESQAEMSTIQNRLDQLYPDANRDLGIYLQPLKEEVVGNVGGYASALRSGPVETRHTGVDPKVLRVMFFERKIRQTSARPYPLSTARILTASSQPIRRLVMNGKWKSSFASIPFSSQAICQGTSRIGGTRDANAFHADRTRRELRQGM